MPTLDDMKTFTAIDHLQCEDGGSMNHDLISRDAVLDACSQSINILDAMSRIEDLPSVTPQPKTGHWIEHPEIETSVSEYIMFYECSECGDKQCFCKSNIHRKHFCNNCGAKMEKQA